MAILWHEMWHEALEEASRQYFGESNVEAMLATLMPLHEMMAQQGPTTLKEIAFVQVPQPHCHPLWLYFALCSRACITSPSVHPHISSSMQQTPCVSACSVKGFQIVTSDF